MRTNSIESMRELLRVSSAAQLLLEKSKILALSPRVRELFPEAKEGAKAETVFGEAASFLQDFSGGTMAFSFRTLTGRCNAALTAWRGGILATLTPEEDAMGRETMLAAAERIRQFLETAIAMSEKLLPQLEESPRNLEQAAAFNQSLYSILRLSWNLEQAARAGEAPLERGTVELGTFLENLTQQLQPMCAMTGRTLHFTSSGERFVCEMDRERLELVLLNLMSNSIKFSDPDSTITLTLRKSGQYACVTLRDQGKGIPADEIGHVFSRGEHRGQIPNPTWGTGMGMIAAKRILEAYNGKIMLESKEQVGTAVHVFLPLYRGTILPIRDQVKLPESSGGINRKLVALADVLPAEAFDPRGIN